MKNSLLKITFIGLSACALLFTSCESEESFEQVEQNAELTKAKAFAEEIGYHPDDIKIDEFLLPDGSTEERIFIEDDIALQASDFYALENMNTFAKQYRTNNLVTGTNRTIDVIGFTGGGGQGLTNTQRTALQWAVDNYNRLSGVTLTFRLTFGTAYQDKDMVIYRNPSNSGAGGSAGFPSNGRPNKFVQLYAGMDAYDTNVNEHVITHEIGHSIGFRHTDYFSRASCGDNVNEGDGGVGAIRVAGTPSGYDATSVMLSCFSSGEDGEFGSNDIIALQNMY
ncbi:Dual-action HEIGH metallo-peptidase [Nonlabens sp. Hel1_33_55]|uniref:M57 family metalloprotease n=1 Tax=Nonlabens sp. Hel1_33_55 TaxID=1336802 RepID=UPI000875E5FF|nr:M57 family metalloprotease [Nonlabens sp. Hel1_33_55]SCY17767.1 Dual-action HEIGH metallo-peptidase [Nonlabens sp. Hel1_33_55]